MWFFKVFSKQYLICYSEIWFVIVICFTQPDCDKTLLLVLLSFAFKYFQDEVYEHTAKVLIPSVTSGFNATVFAYGATGKCAVLSNVITNISFTN